MRHLAGLALVASTLSVTAAASAQPFSQPPDGEPVVASDGRYDGHYDAPYDRPYYPPDYYTPKSTVRIFTGPVLRISKDSPDGGLFAAVDVGEKAAGLRLNGAWVHVGGDRGLAQYGGELWVDFNYHGPLHPVVGAGAAAARIEAANATGGTDSYTIGVGTLRGSLQYALPIRDTDARASIDVIGAVPAIRGSDAPDSSAYLLALATVGVGF